MPRKYRFVLLFDPTLERLDHSVAQFLGRYFRRDLRVIVLRIVVAPLVVLVSADLSGTVLLGSSRPGIDQFRDTGSVLPFSRINTEKDFALPGLYGQTVAILQSK